jgi:hypothetical protein
MLGWFLTATLNPNLNHNLNPTPLTLSIRAANTTLIAIQDSNAGAAVALPRGRWQECDSD